MTIAFTRTREQLAAMVLRKLGIVATGGSGASNDLTVVYEAIDLRLKEMHRLGTFWRKVDKTGMSFSISAGVRSASATADILFPIAMTVVNSSNDDPVEIIDIKTYAAIENKTEQGTPTKVLWMGTSEFMFWPVPTTSGTAKLIYEKVADDTAASTAPDVDVAMLRWLKDIIAYDLADDFSQAEPKIQRLMKESAIAEINIRRLAVQHVDYAPVAVDDFDGRPANTETDYGR